MSNEIDFDTFDTFYEENKDKIFMPRASIGTRTLNTGSINQWYRNIETTTLPKNVKDIYLFFANTLMNVYQYIDFSQFMETLWHVTVNLVARINNQSREYSYSLIYFYIPENISKSNMWVTLLVFHLIKTTYPETFHNNKTIIKFSSNFSLMYDECDRLINEREKILCIYCDDMSYTGNQLDSNLNEPHYKFRNSGWCRFKNRIDLFIAIPYFTRTAQEKFNNETNTEISVTVIFPDRPVIVPSYIEALEKIYGAEYRTPCKDIKNIFEHPDEHLHFYRACNGDPNPEALETFKTLVPIYFDHKVADEFSTFKKILFTGSYPIPDESECKVTPLINGCTFEGIGETDTNNCTQGDGFKNEIPCYPTFYKGIEYTMYDYKMDLNFSLKTALETAKAAAEALNTPKRMKKSKERGGTRRKRGGHRKRSKCKKKRQWSIRRKK